LVVFICYLHESAFPSDHSRSPRKRLEALKVGRNGLLISHLMFADDFLLFTHKQWRTILSML